MYISIDLHVYMVQFNIHVFEYYSFFVFSLPVCLPVVQCLEVLSCQKRHPQRYQT